MKISNKNIVLALLIGVFSGCTALVPDSMLRTAHQDMDKNHDGYIDYNEYLKSSSHDNITKKAKERKMTIEEYQKWDFNRADTDKNGKVTEQELINLFRREG